MKTLPLNGATGKRKTQNWRRILRKTRTGRAHPRLNGPCAQRAFESQDYVGGDASGGDYFLGIGGRRLHLLGRRRNSELVYANWTRACSPYRVSDANHGQVALMGSAFGRWCVWTPTSAVEGAYGSVVELRLGLSTARNRCQRPSYVRPDRIRSQQRIEGVLQRRLAERVHLWCTAAELAGLLPGNATFRLEPSYARGCRPTSQGSILSITHRPAPATDRRIGTSATLDLSTPNRAATGLSTPVPLEYRHDYSVRIADRYD